MLFFLRSLSANERSAALYAFLFAVVVRKRTILNVSADKGTYKKWDPQKEVSYSETFGRIFGRNGGFWFIFRGKIRKGGNAYSQLIYPRNDHRQLRRRYKLRFRIYDILNGASSKFDDSIFPRVCPLKALGVQCRSLGVFLTHWWARRPFDKL